MSYSQSDEEKHILVAADADFGHFIDIGAFDGKTFSNTLALVERGWSGVMVEPSYRAFGALLERHGGNDRIKLVQALVGISRGLTKFWNSADAVSTTEARSYDLWKPLANYMPSCYVPQITVRDLLIEFPTMASVVSIDTEGTSAQLFLLWPIDLCSPKVFSIEHDSRQREIIERGKDWGYRPVYESNENLVLVR